VSQVISAVYLLAHGEVKDGTGCYFVGLLTIWGWNAAVNYLFCLCLEIYIKIKRPLDMGYSTRLKLYHA
jgi:hypothetical protein